MEDFQSTVSERRRLLVLFERPAKRQFSNSEALQDRPLDQQPPNTPRMSVGEGRGAPSQACNKRGQERKEDEEFELGKLESSQERETMPPFLATACLPKTLC